MIALKNATNLREELDSNIVIRYLVPKKSIILIDNVNVLCSIKLKTINYCCKALHLRYLRDPASMHFGKKLKLDYDIPKIYSKSSIELKVTSNNSWGERNHGKYLHLC